MLKNSKAFGSFSVNDISEAREFYSETLGLEVQIGTGCFFSPPVATAGCWSIQSRTTYRQTLRS
jgi:hypothetical protein